MQCRPCGTQSGTWCTLQPPRVRMICFVQSLQGACAAAVAAAAACTGLSHAVASAAACCRQGGRMAAGLPKGGRHWGPTAYGWPAPYPHPNTHRRHRHPHPAAGLPELVPSFPDLHYPPAMLAIESAALAGWTAVLAAGAYATVKVGLAVAAAPGGPALLAALGVWTAASMTAATLLPAPATRGGARSGAAGGDGSSGAGAGVKQE